MYPESTIHNYLTNGLARGNGFRIPEEKSPNQAEPCNRLRSYNSRRCRNYDGFGFRFRVIRLLRAVRNQARRGSGIMLLGQQDLPACHGRFDKTSRSHPRRHSVLLYPKQWSSSGYPVVEPQRLSKSRGYPIEYSR